MSDNLHDPRRLHEALAPHAKRLGLTTCSSCGREPSGARPLHLCVLPYSNSIHATPQLSPLCDDCAMEVAEALSEMHDP